MRNSGILLAAVAALSTASPASAITFINEISISGAATDLSNIGNGPNANRLGGFGSDLVYDAHSDSFFGLTDRGPGGGLIDYAPRIQTFSLNIDRHTGAVGGFNLTNTTIFRDESGVAFSGLNPGLLNGNAAVLGRSLDSEGLVRLANGHYLVSDEYGPSVIEFDANGKRVRTFETPANLLPKRANSTTDYVAGRPDIVTGRQDNRGFEGLTVSADGTKAYAILQDPLVNEGAQNDGRRSRNVRIVVFDMATGKSDTQYIYRLEDRDNLNTITPNDTFSATNQGRSIGVSAIYALSDGRFVVLERDNRGLGVDPATLLPVALKSAFVINLAGATNVANISLANSNGLPNGVVAVSKTAFLDIRAKLLAQGIVLPEKIEGLAFGPRLVGGGVSLILMTDNDYSVTQTGSGEQFDVCTNGTGSVMAQVSFGGVCPNGLALIPTRIFSFALSREEAIGLGFSAVPEPASWAMMVAGFGLAGGAVRRRRKAPKSALA